MSGKVRLMAVEWYIHDGRRLNYGDQFDAFEHEACELVALGKAKRVKAAPPQAKKKNTYKRRDMRAE